MNVGNIQLSVQRQLKDDWDNREYVQLISDNVKNIADFLTQFEVSCKGKLAELDDRITNIERKLDFLEALVVLVDKLFSKMAGTTGRVTKAGADALTRYVAPVVSTSRDEARRRVLAAYKEVQRLVPKFWFEYDLRDMPLPALRSVLKKQFTKEAHLTDIRAIDRRVEETHYHIENIRMYYYNKDHVRNMLFGENVEPQPKDFLSRFLTRKD